METLENQPILWKHPKPRANLSPCTRRAPSRGQTKLLKRILVPSLRSKFKATGSNWFNPKQRDCWLTHNSSRVQRRAYSRYFLIKSLALWGMPWEEAPRTQVIAGGEDGRAQPGAVVAVGEGREAALQPTVLCVQDGKPNPQAQQYQEQDGHHHSGHVSGSGSMKG